jgi:putative ABC transport system permease protein
VAGYRKIIAGRELKTGYEMVLDKRLSDAGGFQVGQVMERMGHSFRVVGVVETGVPVRIFMPIQTLQEILHAEGRASFFFVKCTAPEKITQVSREIEERFQNLTTFYLGNYYQALAGSFWGLRVFIRSVTAVALVISFLVILLATYTSVLERTREIGILKALGATRAFILKEIIAESLVIAICGVIFGYGLSILSKAAVELKYPLLTVDITWARILLAAALGVVGGVLGAMYPGMLAVRKDAVVALSYE